MRSSWKRILSGFQAQARSPQFRKQFEVMKTGEPALAIFPSPETLVIYQHCAIPSHAHHDEVLRALLDSYRSSSVNDVAGALLFLCVEPGLACVYGKVRRVYGDDSDAAGDVTLAFFEALRGWSYEETTRIAAGLKLNVMRAVFVRLERAFRDRDRVDQVLEYSRSVLESEVDAELPKDEISASAAWRSFPGAKTAFDPGDLEVRQARRYLTARLRLKNAESRLLILRGPCNLSWSEIGSRLGVNHETARKRHQRLLRRIRQHPAVKAGCPDFEICPRILGVRDDASNINEE